MFRSISQIEHQKRVKKLTGWIYVVFIALLASLVYMTKPAAKQPETVIQIKTVSELP